MDRESPEWKQHGAPEGTLPLCEHNSKSVLENVLRKSGHFLLLRGEWIYMRMAENQDIREFMDVGKELQRQVDAGDYKHKDENSG